MAGKEGTGMSKGRQSDDWNYVFKNAIFAVASFFAVRHLQRWLPTPAATPGGGWTHYFSMEYTFHPYFENYTGLPDPDTDPDVPYRSELLYAVPLAAIWLIARHFYERHLATPVGRKFKLRETRVTCKPNPGLEKAFSKQKRPNAGQIHQLSDETGLSEAKVSRWFFCRRSRNKATVMSKFCETSWQMLFYFCSFVLGAAVLSKTDWLWNWRNTVTHPWNFHLPHSIAVYYLLECSFYISLTLTQFRDVRRSDFWEMFVHHVITVVLMFVSWCYHQARIGTIIMILHDSSDWLMLLAKIFRYIGMKTACDVTAVIFVPVFFITRLVMFPWLVYDTWNVHAIVIYGTIPYFIAGNVLVVSLMVLHVFWFGLIVNIVVSFLRNRGEGVKDSRSESEDEAEGNEVEGRKEDEGKDFQRGVAANLKKVNHLKTR